MQVKIKLRPLVFRRPVPFSWMFTLAPAEAVSTWGGFETPESRTLREHLSRMPNPEVINPRQAPFGSSRCLVLGGSAGCGASLFAADIEFEGVIIETTAIITPEVDLEDSEYPCEYDTSSELLGWIHMPPMRGLWVLIDPICSGDEALPEGLRLNLESTVDLCVSLRLYLFGNDLAQLHMLMDSGSESVRRLLGLEFCSATDREIPRMPEEATGSDLSI